DRSQRESRRAQHLSMKKENGRRKLSSQARKKTTQSRSVSPFINQQSSSSNMNRLSHFSKFIPLHAPLRYYSHTKSPLAPKESVIGEWNAPVGVTCRKRGHAHLPPPPQEKSRRSEGHFLVTSLAAHIGKRRLRQPRAGKRESGSSSISAARLPGGFAGKKGGLSSSYDMLQVDNNKRISFRQMFSAISTFRLFSVVHQTKKRISI
ncbi:hypothetical protein CEXT_136071, partial [Caerostris extrusa]